MFITLEGAEGSGKTTQTRLLVERLRREGYPALLLHEPGGTALGEQIRALLLQKDGPPIEPVAEALLFTACRAQLVTTVIRPALERGELVVADRFADSTRAYQGAGRGLPATALESLIGIATGGLTPDLTILLQVSTECGLGRRARGDQAEWTRFEAEEREFHERVCAAYEALARVEPERWCVVDAEQSVEAVHTDLWKAVANRLVAAASSR